MNIFFLHDNPSVAASLHCDVHVVKMILETAQLLSTAHRVLDGEQVGKKWVHPDPEFDEILYAATHRNHPCAVWVRETSANYMWTWRLFDALIVEYRNRYGRDHLSSRLLSVLSSTPRNMRHSSQITRPAQAMPDQYRSDDAVTAYRAYYANEKTKMTRFAYHRSKKPSLWPIRWDDYKTAI